MRGQCRQRRRLRRGLQQERAERPQLGEQIQQLGPVEPGAVDVQPGVGQRLEEVRQAGGADVPRSPCHWKLRSSISAEVRVRRSVPVRKCFSS